MYIWCKPSHKGSHNHCNVKVLSDNNFMLYNDWGTNLWMPRYRKIFFSGSNLYQCRMAVHKRPPHVMVAICCWPSTHSKGLSDNPLLSPTKPHLCPSSLTILPLTEPAYSKADCLLVVHCLTTPWDIFWLLCSVFPSYHTVRYDSSRYLGLKDQSFSSNKCR